VEQIHFHEVGELDAIADIVAVCLLIDLLKPDQIYCTPVHVGAGHVRCAHGILPVPAPATALLLRGVPIYGGAIQGELCTPTGAALLKYFCSFERQPVFIPQAIGYGMGTKDFEQANCVRAMLGEAADKSDSVVELCCNLDDMTPEAIGFAIERLCEAPALDVYTIPIGMKKGRPGTMLCCLVHPEDAQAVSAAILRHTTTLGVREHTCSRTTLERRMNTIPSEWGNLHIKEAFGQGVRNQKVEYDDAARVAKTEGISLAEATTQNLKLVDKQ
jgi:pyridinium-3,5-bisthiocarboxylic acid mononucleotide nickel chelatase